MAFFCKWYISTKKILRFVLWLKTSGIPQTMVCRILMFTWPVGSLAMTSEGCNDCCSRRSITPCSCTAGQTTLLAQRMVGTGMLPAFQISRCQYILTFHEQPVVQGFIKLIMSHSCVHYIYIYIHLSLSLSLCLAHSLLCSCSLCRAKTRASSPRLPAARPGAVVPGS